MAKWTTWSEWTSPGKTCGIGTQTRRRYCSDSGQKGICHGHYTEKRLDLKLPCPIWSHWGYWSECSTKMSCGKGKRIRTRSCLHGGQVNSTDLNCMGSTEEKQDCRMPNCKAVIQISNELVQILDDTSNPAQWRFICKDSMGDEIVYTTLSKQLGYGPLSAPANNEGQYTTHLSILGCEPDKNNILDCNHIWKEKTQCSQVLKVKYEGEKSSQCEGGAATLQCATDKFLHIFKATFKANSSLCTGVSLSTMIDCSKFNPNNILKKIQNLCEGQTKCDIPANVEYFGGPCEEGSKKLSVHYECTDVGVEVWESWSSWSLCNRNGNQDRKRIGRYVKSTERTMQYRNCFHSNHDLHEPFWIDGDSGFRYKVLDKTYDSVHHAQMACHQLDSSLLSTGFDSQAELLEILEIIAKHHHETISTFWIGIFQHCNDSSCLWMRSDGTPISDDIKKLISDNNSKLKCAKLISGFQLVPAPCEYVDYGVVVCEKPKGMKFIEMDNSYHQLRAFDEVSFSFKYVASTSWNQRNSDVFCQQFNKKAKKDYEFFHEGLRYIPMQPPSVISDSVARCQGFGGSIERFKKYKVLSSQYSAGSWNATIKQIVHYNFKHCFAKSSNSEKDNVCNLFKGNLMYFCITKVPCTHGLLADYEDDRNIVTVSSTLFINATQTLSVNYIKYYWAGLIKNDSDNQVSMYDGWQPNFSDNNPWIIFTLKCINNITSIQILRKGESSDIIFHVWYSLDGKLWFGPKYKNNSAQIRFPSVHANISHIDFTKKENKHLPFPASFIKIESKSALQDTFKFEVFGCELDTEIDLFCDKRLPPKLEKTFETKQTHQKFYSSSSLDAHLLRAFMYQNYFENDRTLLHWIAGKMDSTHSSSFPRCFFSYVANYLWQYIRYILH
ncbi:uncharacterized protein LOC144421956 [Styela clava]